MPVCLGSLEFAGQGRMYQAYRDMEQGSTKKVEVFRSRAEAMVFLGMSDI